MNNGLSSVSVSPEVFKWLRESSGWKIEEVAKRLNTNIKTIEEIELGKKNPTFNQLKDLSVAFKRPVAAFFLSEPKEEKPKPKDYRMLPQRSGIFDKKTILAIRKARRLQELGSELSGNINYETKPKIEKVPMSEDPVKLAQNYRNLFALTEEKQKKFITSYEMFHYLRDILEDMNILVFQFSMPLEDARGFALVDNSPFIIVINSKDTIEARLFSMMHEFAHILLGESAIDIPDVSIPTKNGIEKWCNVFSSSFLLPKEIAESLFKSEAKTLTSTKTLNYLSKKYKISKAMLLVNMLKMNYITKESYDDVLNRYEAEKLKIPERGHKGGGVSSDKKRISEMGTKFVSIVANNYDKKHITYTDALNYLSIKARNFDKLLAKARK